MPSKILNAVTAATLAGTCALSLSTAASAAETAPVSTISAADQATISSRLRSHGATADQVSTILADLERGIEPQSMTDEATPVSVKTYEDDAYTITEYRYADGSYNEVAEEIPRNVSVNSGATTQSTSITGCTSRTGSGYITRSNCQIKGEGATYEAQFTASFSETLSGGTIHSANTPTVKVIGGTLASTPSLKIVRKTSSGYDPARAALTWSAKLKEEVAGGTTSLVLDVTRSAAKVSVK